MKYIKTFENTKSLNISRLAILNLINKYIDFYDYKVEKYYDHNKWEMEFKIGSIKCTTILEILENEICITVNTPNFTKRLKDFNNIFDFFINYLKNIKGMKYVKKVNLMAVENVFYVTNSKEVINELTKNINLLYKANKYNL
jgi:hypothetical protein